jgi:hypothetical protein
MKRWLLFFLAILATSLTAVEARAEIPAFVRPGLVVSYSGEVDNFNGVKRPSSQKITVNGVTSNPGIGTIVSGTTVLSTYLSGAKTPQGVNIVTDDSITVQWSCIENRECTLNPPQSGATRGAIAQFWVNPTNPIGSILGPKRELYTNNTCPSEVVIGNVTCLDSKGPLAPGGPVPSYIVRLAFDTTGLVRYFDQNFQPLGTLQGDGSGQLTYTSQMTIPWQVDSSSIVFQHDTGPVAVWEMNETTPSVFGSPVDLSPDWRVVGTGDFYHHGLFDILFQNANGLIAIWEMDGTTRISAGNVATPPLGWRVAAVGDFDHDGYSDILFQHSSGAIAVWTMKGTTPTFGSGYDPGGQGWHVVGTGDFNVPGKSDILWQHDSGLVAIWEMNGTTPSGGWNVMNFGPGWYALGSGHFYGGNNCDILFQHTSGLVAIWEVIGHTPTGRGGNLPTNPGPGWHVVGIGDYNGDGKSDIMWRHDGGTVAVWEMNGITPIVYGNGVDPGAGWNS